jgi:hypothetical protein
VSLCSLLQEAIAVIVIVGNADHNHVIRTGSAPLREEILLVLNFLKKTFDLYLVVYSSADGRVRFSSPLRKDLQIAFDLITKGLDYEVKVCLSWRRRHSELPNMV